MRTPIRAAALMLVAWASARAHAQPPAARTGDPAPPAPGTRGNPDNVPFIGRGDPHGNPVRLAKSTGHVSNYSEEKVRAYTLPDPLVLANGARVASADQWLRERRPEILKFYREQIYGHVPASAPAVTWTVAETNAGARGGSAVMRRVTGRMGSKPDGPRMNLTVYLPARASGPVPLLLSITFGFPAARPGTAKVGQPPATTPAKATPAKPAAGPGARRRRLRSRGGGARPRLGLCLAPVRRNPAGPRRPLDRRRYRPHAQGGADDRPRTNGAPSAPGRGASVARSTTCKPIRPSTPGGSASPALRVWARPFSGRPRRTSALRRCFPSSPARWERP